jgi:plasmid stabilization system protein ParE
VKLIISPQATSDIDVAVRWWRANRPRAPELLDRELREVFEFIIRTPHAGIPMRSGQPRNVRRVPLPRTRYLLYYRVIEAEQGTVRVLRVWHVSRGSKPKL